MSGQWKPGDVAMVKAEWVRGVAQAEGAVKMGRGWQSLLTGGFIYDSDMLDARPLVVIDPEDREQVERLADILHSPSGRWLCAGVENIQAALREFANPTPPKPEEPTGLGAVVESTNGDLWVRVDASGVWACASDEDKIATYWPTISAVKVLSEGVTP